MKHHLEDRNRDRPLTSDYTGEEVAQLDPSKGSNDLLSFSGYGIVSHWRWMAWVGATLALAVGIRYGGPRLIEWAMTNENAGSHSRFDVSAGERNIENALKIQSVLSTLSDSTSYVKDASSYKLGLSLMAMESMRNTLNDLEQTWPGYSRHKSKPVLDKLIHGEAVLPLELLTAQDQLTDRYTFLRRKERNNPLVDTNGLGEPPSHPNLDSFLNN